MTTKARLLSQLLAPGGAVADGSVQASKITGTIGLTVGGTGAQTAPAARSNLGLAIGSDVQQWHSVLDNLIVLAGTSGFLKKSGSNNWQLDTNTYLTGNQTITFSGDASGSGATTVSLTLANSGVTAGTYGSSTAVPVLVVDAKGRITSISTQNISGALTFTGDVTGSGSTGSSTALTLANSGVTAGTYTKVTVDAKGRATSGTTLSASDIPSLDASKITTGTIDAARLPSYVDDVLEFANLAGFPATGETGKIYVALDSNKTYRWSGSTYIEISANVGTVTSVTGTGTVSGLTLSGTVTTSGSLTLGGAITGFVPTTGGTMTAPLVFTSSNTYNPIQITGGVAGYYPAVQDGNGRVNWYWNKAGSGGAPTFEVSGEDAVRMKFSTSQAAGTEAGVGVYWAAAGSAGAAITWTEILGAFHNRFQYLGNTILHSGNYTSYALPLTGGTSTGQQQFNANVFVNGNFGQNATTTTYNSQIKFDNSFNDTARGPNKIELYNSSWLGGFGIHNNTLAIYSGGVTNFYNGATAYNSVGTTTLSFDATNISYKGNAVLHAANYSSYALPLTGGTITPSTPVVISRSNSGTEPYIGLTIQNSSTSAGIKFVSSARAYEIQSGTDGSFLIYDRTADAYRFTINSSGTLFQGNLANAVLHAGNYSSYALPLSGGTLTGTLAINGGNGLRVFVDGGASITSHLYFANAANNRAYNWQLDESSNAALWGYGGSAWAKLLTVTSGGAVSSVGSFTSTDNANVNGSNFVVDTINKSVALYAYDVRRSGSTVGGITIGGVGVFASGTTIGGNTALHAGNYTSYLNNTYMRSIGYASSSNDWNSLGNSYPNTVEQVDPTNFSSTANGPTAASYTFGTLLNFASQSSSQAQIYISHAGNDLIFRGGWNGASWQAWNKVLTNQNYTSYSPTLTGSGASGTWGINVTGSAATVGASTSTGIQNSFSTTINTTTPGTGFYGLNFSGGGTADNASGITWAWSSSGAQAGIYVQSSGSYGTKMYLATTDSFATGAKTAVSIDHGGHVNIARGALTQGGNQVLHAGNYTSYALPLAGGTTTGSVHVGAAIGSRGTSLSVSGSNASSPFAAKSGSYSTVFAMLPWSSGQTYLSTGTYYDGSSWVHASSDTTNALLAFSGGSGAIWYASNNSSPSWNTASGVALWNQSGTWTGALNASSGAQVAGNTVLHAGNFTNYAPGSGSNWTFNELYSNGWFRNNSSNQGLYNQSSTQHWSSNTNGYWDASSTTSFSGIRFYTGGHVSSLRGYVYANTSNEIGFLNSSGSWSWRMDNSGNGTATGNVTAYSDERLKQNWNPLPDNFVERLASIKCGTYNRIDQDMRQVGVSAQSLQALLPEAVLIGSDENKTLSVAYGNAALAATVELAKRVVEQQQQIAELTALVKTLLNKE